MMSSVVTLVKIGESNIEDALSRLFDMLRLPDQAEKIGIKINLCDYRKRETGVTTDPRVLDQLLKILRGIYPETYIYLFENDASGTLADNLYKWLQLDKIANKYGVNFVNLCHEKWQRVKVDGYHFKEIEVPEILMNSIIINHPKLKTHGRTKMSCGLKNMYGCYRIKRKEKYHVFLDEAIVDINIPIKSHITIVDGYLGVEGNRGPTQGFPKKVGVFIGGNDVVAVDSFCARFMGFNPRFVGHIAKAEKRGVGSMSYQLKSDIPERDFRKYRFEFSMPKYWLMEGIRKILR